MKIPQLILKTTNRNTDQTPGQSMDLYTRDAILKSRPMEPEPDSPELGRTDWKGGEVHIVHTAVEGEWIMSDTLVDVEE